MSKAPKPASPGATPAAKPAKPKSAAKPRVRAAAGKPAVTAKATTAPRVSAVAAVSAAPKAVIAAVPKPAPKPGRDKRDDAPTLRRKDFLARVLLASGVKKKDAQSVVDATLKTLGEALSKGESLALPPFGRARVSRQVDQSDGELLVIKLHRGGSPKPGKGKKSADESLADTDD
ncbi:HU family DNA-binding protein [Phaeovulum sp.]|uniref:HU family DNA-binding protein n=1 Tax=Phaeovulum sp. TaxID=2934796 RepID=UPI00272F0462|nr:HU family DNA-binding protein [Phaeovulum sp.]MDP1669593.1 HU family DNA-binding protein [Phaeovulum sp.]MDP2064267.1 HU family DNA-binding protein [Phaeovulum sp.]MDP3862413.1 HU family DNA-binding protein [Phaeovulum sp.]MDZ4119767.1 HU family DNA-binding protein [Phaeovulum sp.]